MTTQSCIVKPYPLALPAHLIRREDAAFHGPQAQRALELARFVLRSRTQSLIMLKSNDLSI